VAMRAENSLELPIRRPRLSASLSNLLGCGADLPTLQLQKSRAQRRNETPPALVQRLDIPHFRELPQRALDLKGLDLFGGRIRADILLHSVPVPKTEGRFGECREIPIRIAFRLGHCRKLSHEALRHTLESEVGSNLQAQAPRTGEQRHQIDAM